MVNEKNKIFLEDFSKRPELIGILVDALVATISNFTQVVVTAGPASLRVKREGHKFAAASVIRFQGASLSMELVLALPKPLLLRMASQVFKQDVGEVSVAQDLVGELLNISFGTIDPMMAGRGHKLKSSFPQNFSGGRLTSLFTELPQERIYIPLAAGSEEFALEILAPGALGIKWAYTP